MQSRERHEPASASNFTGAFLPSGTVSFAAGQSTQIVTINVNGSTVVAPSEGFTVTLSSPSSPATLGTSTAEGLIENNNTEALRSQRRMLPNWKERAAVHRLRSRSLVAGAQVRRQP